jgi:hypothetical protein
MSAFYGNARQESLRRTFRNQVFAASAGGLRGVLSRRRLVRVMADPARAATIGRETDDFDALIPDSPNGSGRQV